jgi:CRISPR-associated protein Csd2
LTWQQFIPEDIRSTYEIVNHLNAAQVLATAYPHELQSALTALRSFSLTRDDIRAPGGNESDITKRFTEPLRKDGWYETRISADLVVTKSVRVPKETKNGKRQTESTTETATREKYLDGHLIDFVRGKVALDFEWNSKDQTFDRDLYAFRAFFESGAIEAAMLVTRGVSLNEIFKSMGPEISAKYGASTTWLGKLRYRLEAGRGGGCPILVFGITDEQIRNAP